MGKKLIIKGADFSENGIVSREKIVLIKDTYIEASTGVVRTPANDGGMGLNWYTTGRLTKKSNTYRLEGADGASARFLKIKDNSVLESSIITLPITLDVSNADEFAFNFPIEGRFPGSEVPIIDENLLDDIFLYPL